MHRSATPRVFSAVELTNIWLVFIGWFENVSFAGAYVTEQDEKRGDQKMTAPHTRGREGRRYPQNNPGVIIFSGFFGVKFRKKVENLI